MFSNRSPLKSFLTKIYLNRSLPFILAAVIFLLDLWTPSDFDAWVIFLIPVVWISWTSAPFLSFSMAFLCSIFTYVAYLYSPALHQGVILLNSTVGVVLFWVFTVMLTRHRTKEEHFRRTRENWERQLTDRNAELEEAHKAILQRSQRLQESRDQLRVITSRLRNAEEAERRRIAGEIHDGLTAHLSAVKFTLEAAIRKLKEGEPLDIGKLEDVNFRLQQNIAETRKIMNNLRPAVLDELGILPAIQWFCREYESAYSHIRIQKEIEIQEVDIPDSLKIVMFRLLQESLNNFAKHGNGNLVRLSLQRDNGKMDFTIQDNGQGFDVEHCRKGLGLASMRERVESTGGSFSIQSAKGAGTTLRASWPQRAGSTPSRP